MSDRRNPYLVLGVDFAASPDEAADAFARVSRRVRRQADAPYRIDDITWALHQIEQAGTDPKADISVYRVPADATVFDLRSTSGALAPPAVNLPRTTGPSDEVVDQLMARVLDHIGLTGLDAVATALLRDRSMPWPVDGAVPGATS